MEEAGSKTPLVVLSFHNCELHCCHLDGYRSDKAAMLRRLSEIEAYFLAKPAHAKFRIWFNVDQTLLDKTTAHAVAQSLARIRGHIYKIAFVGPRGFAKRRFHLILNDTLQESDIPKAYFTDAEQAKEWLI